MLYLFFFFFNDTATTEIYTLSLHDALPIWMLVGYRRLGLRYFGSMHALDGAAEAFLRTYVDSGRSHVRTQDRKSTRLNSSHLVISYAVFCLKKKKHLV